MQGRNDSFDPAAPVCPIAALTKYCFMKKLHFAKDEGNEFYKTLLKRVKEHFATNGIPLHGNTQMLFKSCMYFVLTGVFYALVLMSHTVWAFYLYYLVMGLFVLLTAFNVSHDAAHGIAVKSKRLNKLLFHISFNLQGNNAYVWGKYHNESHHLYTNIEGSDIDVLDNPLIRMTAAQKRRWYHRYQQYYAPFLYLLYSLNWFLFRETLMVFGKSSRTIHIKLPFSEVINVIFFKLFYIGYMIVVPIWVLDIGAVHVFTAFVLNHFMVSLIFTAVLGVSHLSDRVIHPVPDEKGNLGMSWPKLQMKTSLDYNSGSVFFNWTLGGFNAHALHHLLPNICHVHYLEVLPIFRKTAAEFGIEYMEVKYPNALASHFRFLKKMGHAD